VKNQLNLARKYRSFQNKPGFLDAGCIKTGLCVGGGVMDPAVFLGIVPKVGKGRRNAAEITKKDCSAGAVLFTF
jgi:hypothetical protein